MSPTREKLLELLESIESLLEQSNDDAWLEAETIERLGDMGRFIREWLADESALPETTRLATLARLTDALAPAIATREDAAVTLH